MARAMRLRRSRDRTSFECVTPTGKVGYVLDDAIGALDSDQLCFVKEAAGWKITGYADN